MLLLYKIVKGIFVHLKNVYLKQKSSLYLGQDYFILNTTVHSEIV